MELANKRNNQIFSNVVATAPVALSGNLPKPPSFHQGSAVGAGIKPRVVVVAPAVVAAYPPVVVPPTSGGGSGGSGGGGSDSEKAETKQGDASNGPSVGFIHTTGGKVAIGLALIAIAYLGYKGYKHYTK